MSSSLALGSVTAAVLRRMLEESILLHGLTTTLGTAEVSALARPDRL